MWHNYTFSQRNKITKRTLELEVGGDREGEEGWTKFENGDRGVGNMQ